MSITDLMGEKFNKQSVHDICLHRRTTNLQRLTVERYAYLNCLCLSVVC